MQRFFLFCIMLILTSEAFPKQFHKNQLSEGRKLNIHDLISNQGNPSSNSKCMAGKFINSRMLNSNDFKFRKSIGKIKIRGTSKKNKYKKQLEKKYKSYFLPIKSKKPDFVHSFYDSFTCSNNKKNCYNNVFIHHPQKLKRSTKESNSPIQFSDYGNFKKHNVGNDYSEKVKSLNSERNFKNVAWKPRIGFSDGVSTMNRNEYSRPYRTSYSFSSFNNYDSPNHLTIPKINFKFPYNPKLYEYEGSLESPSAIMEKPLNKLEDSDNKNQPHDSYKLKEMAEKLENVLREEHSANLTSQTKSLQDNQEYTTESAEFIREKIDKIAIPILAQISDELGRKVKEVDTYASKSPKGKSEQKSTSKPESKDAKNNKCLPKGCDSGCSADGIWLSNTVGAELNITTLPNMMLKVTITSSKRNGFVTKKWYMQGLTLSKRGGPLILAGVCPLKRKVASFIGQCKVCEEEDVIFGLWTLTGCAHRCNDIWASMETKLDILKRTSIIIRKFSWSKSKGHPVKLEPFALLATKCLAHINNLEHLQWKYSIDCMTEYKAN